MQKQIRFTLNRRPVSATVRPDDNLIDMLSQQFDLKGARESCGQGLCGCCTVYVDGLAVSGCLSLASMVDGSEITTVEGLERNNQLHPVQEAFIEAGAFQCGFCTPGFIMMVNKLLERHPHPSDEQIRHYLSGNLCRCSAYPEIIDAVKIAAEKIAATDATQA